MFGLKGGGWRQHSGWLAVAISVLMVVLALGPSLLWPVESLGLTPNGDDGFLAAVRGRYRSPQTCRECHPDEYEAWAHTTHAQASFDPVFQVYLQQVEEPGECLSCHTTGYNVETGQFALAGVTCEACHGPYRPDHPQQSMTIAASEELCGTCHQRTRQEWQTSRHGEVGITCIACHEMHAQRTRAEAATGALCANCHGESTQDQVHALHRQQGVTCIRCHLSRPEGEVPVSGKMPTGHSFDVFLRTCRDCHTASELPFFLNH